MNSYIRTIISELRLAEVNNSSILHVTANENQLSRTAAYFLASKLSERYYFGGGDKDRIIDFGSYTFRGIPEVERLVQKASRALKDMVGGSSVNLNCFSGLHAMMCAILVTTEPGDIVMSLRFEDGGHAATKGIIENLGRKHVFAEFDLKKNDINVEASTRIFKELKVKVFYVDISTHINPVDVKSLRKALGNKSIIIYDASHSFGLILGKVMESPLKSGADLICTNTHKTFAGPQGGLIVYKDQSFGQRANYLMNTTLVSSVHTAKLIALSISLLEYYKHGQEYARQVLVNATELAKALKLRGYDLRGLSDGIFSRNEQVHVFLNNSTQRVQLYRRLIKNNISTNFMQIFGGRPFIRLGVQEITRRGMKEREMRIIASLIDRALKGEDIKEEVISFTSNFPKVEYSFDNNLKYESVD